MCGIVGFQGEFTEVLLSNMLSKIAHRGPDGVGELLLNNLTGLGHRRLAIIDLSPQGHQPMTVNCHCCQVYSADANNKLWLIYNGELYNYQALRDLLIKKGHQFHSKTDTEVLLHLYAEYGCAMLEQLNGIFSFALYDGRKNGQKDGMQQGDLLLARDGLGVKPLYYAQTQSGFLFSSELKSLLQSKNISREINYAAIHAYFSYLWCPAPQTAFVDIRKFEPGQAMLVRQNHIKKTWYFYDIPYGQTVFENKPQYIAEELAHYLEQAVKRQLMSDVPLGAFLSGGLDSSAVVAMMRKLQPNKKIQCYCIGFSDHYDNEGNAPDLPYAKKVARHLDVDLRTIIIEPKEILKLPQLLYHLDEPQADPAVINALLIAQHAHEDGIKVLLSGAGGDDIFSGYRRHYALQLERYWAWLPLSLQKLGKKIPRIFPPGTKNNLFLRRLTKGLASMGLSSQQRIASYFLWGDEETRRGLYSPMMHEKTQSLNTFSPLLVNLQRIPKNTERLNQMLYLEIKHFLADHNLNYTDKTSMAAGVEVRVPLLDRDLVNFSTKIPVGLKQQGSIGKSIFKLAMEPYLPRDIIYRKKSGFGAPIRSWLKNELKFLVDSVLSPEVINARGIFDATAMQKFIQLDRAGQVDGAYAIFSALSIELWCQIYIDNKTFSF